MIVWIGLYWVLTQLLLKTAVLLRTVYEVPTAIERSPEAKDDLRAAGGENGRQVAIERYGLHHNLHFA